MTVAAPRRAPPGGGSLAIGPDRTQRAVRRNHDRSGAPHGTRGRSDPSLPLCHAMIGRCHGDSRPAAAEGHSGCRGGPAPASSARRRGIPGRRPAVSKSHGSRGDRTAARPESRTPGSPGIGPGSMSEIEETRTPKSQPFSTGIWSSGMILA
eukprot:487825-Hanusia_phi.AAC.2